MRRIEIDRRTISQATRDLLRKSHGIHVELATGGTRVMRECECKNWATTDIRLDSLLGHHHRCPNAPTPEQAMRILIDELVRGMEAWDHDCDGVHPDAWDAYRRAKMFQGKFVDESREG